MLAAKGLCVVLFAHTALQIAAEITKDSIEVDLPNQEFRATRLKEPFLVHRARRSELENGRKGTGVKEVDPKNSGGLFDRFVNWITNRNSDKTEDEEEGPRKSLIDLQLNIESSKGAKGSTNKKYENLDNRESPGKENKSPARLPSKPVSEDNGNETPRTEESHESSEEDSRPSGVLLKTLLDFESSLENDTSEEIPTKLRETTSEKGQNVKGSTNNKDSSGSDEQPTSKGHGSNRPSNDLIPTKADKKFIGEKLSSPNENLDSGEENSEPADKDVPEQGNSDLSEKKRKLLKSLLDFDDSDEDYTEKTSKSSNIQPKTSSVSNESISEEITENGPKKHVSQRENQKGPEGVISPQAKIGEKLDRSKKIDGSVESSEKEEIKPLNQKEKKIPNGNGWNQRFSPKIGLSLWGIQSPRKNKKNQRNSVESNLKKPNIPEELYEKSADRKIVSGGNQNKKPWAPEYNSATPENETRSGINVDYYETKLSQLKGLLSFESPNEDDMSALSSGPTKTGPNGNGVQYASLRGLLNNVGKSGNFKKTPGNYKTNFASLNTDISGIKSPPLKHERSNWLDLSFAQLSPKMSQLSSEYDIDKVTEGDAEKSEEPLSRTQTEQHEPTNYNGFGDVGNLNSLLSLGGAVTRRSKSLKSGPSSIYKSKLHNTRNGNSKASLAESSESSSFSSEEGSRTAFNDIALQEKLRPSNLNSASEFGFKGMKWKPTIDSGKGENNPGGPLNNYGFKGSGDNLRSLLNIGNYGGDNNENLGSLRKSQQKDRNSPFAKNSSNPSSEGNSPTKRQNDGKEQSNGAQGLVVSGTRKISGGENGKSKLNPNEDQKNRKHKLSSTSGDSDGNDNDNIPGNGVSESLRQLTKIGLSFGVNSREPYSLTKNYLQGTRSDKIAVKPYSTETLVNDAHRVKGKGKKSGSGSVPRYGDLKQLLHAQSFGTGGRNVGDYNPTGFFKSEVSSRDQRYPSVRTGGNTPGSMNNNQNKGQPDGKLSDDQFDVMNTGNHGKTPSKIDYQMSFGLRSSDPRGKATNKIEQYSKDKSSGVPLFDVLSENGIPGAEDTSYNHQNTPAKENRGDENSFNYMKGYSGPPQYDLYGEWGRPSQRTGNSIDKDVSSVPNPSEGGGSEYDGILSKYDTPGRKSGSDGSGAPRGARKKVSWSWTTSHLYNPSSEDSDSAEIKIIEDKVVPSDDRYKKKYGGLNLNNGKTPLSNMPADGQSQMFSPDLQSRGKGDSSNWAGTPSALNVNNMQVSKYWRWETSDDQFPQSNEDLKASPHNDQSSRRDGRNNWSESPAGLNKNNWQISKTWTWKTSDDQSPESNAGLTKPLPNDQKHGKDGRNDWSGNPVGLNGKHRQVSKYWTWESSDDQPLLYNRGWSVSSPNDMSRGKDESNNWSGLPAELDGDNWQVSQSRRWGAPDDQSLQSNGNSREFSPIDQSSGRDGSNNWSESPARSYENNQQVSKSWRWETSGDGQFTPGAGNYLEFPEQTGRWQTNWYSRDYHDEDSYPGNDVFDWDENENKDFAPELQDEGELINNAWDLKLPLDLSFSDRNGNVLVNSLIPGGQESSEESRLKIPAQGEYGLKKKKEQNGNPISNPTSEANSKKEPNSDNLYGTRKSFGWNLNLSAPKDQQLNNQNLKWSTSSNGHVDSKGKPNKDPQGGGAINNSSAQLLKNVSNVLGEKADEWTITARANLTGLGTTILDGIRNGITNLRSNAADFAGNAVKNVISATSKGVKAVAETGQKGLQWGQNVFSWMKNAGQKAWEAGKNVVQKAVDGASKIAKKGIDLGSRAIQGISNLGGAASSGLKKLSDFADNSAKGLSGMVDNAVKSTKNSDIPFAEALEAGRKLTRNLVAEASVKVNTDGHYRDFNFKIGGGHSDDK